MGFGTTLYMKQESMKIDGLVCYVTILAHSITARKFNMQHLPSWQTFEKVFVLYLHATPFGDDWFLMHVFTSKLGSLAAKPRAHWYSTVRPTKNEEFRRKFRPLVIRGIDRLQTEK